MPALTLMEKLGNFEIEYIGGRAGIERSLVTSKVNKFYPIFTGKLRRYFSFENFTDIFKIGLGLVQSFGVLLFKPSNTIVFSTGGFVSVPVVIAAWMTGKRIYIHEQTARVGLANKIASKFAHKVFVSFEESIKFFPAQKTELSGYPVRDACFSPLPHDLTVDGIDLSNTEKPILLITGGGNGSKLINDLIRDSLDKIKDKYIIIHQVGKNYLAEYANLKTETYRPVEFINENMIELMKISAVTIARAGAGTVSELMAINKPSIFIPLKIAQKNEQYYNAKEAEERNGSLVIEEDQLVDLDLVKILEMFESRASATGGGKEFKNGTDVILKALNEA